MRNEVFLELLRVPKWQTTKQIANRAGYDPAAVEKLLFEFYNEHIVDHDGGPIHIWKIFAEIEFQFREREEFDV